MCWDIIGLVSSLDILLAFVPDICDTDLCSNCSQLIKGPGASFCYLDLSMAPIGPWVSATFSIYSWLGCSCMLSLVPVFTWSPLPQGDAYSAQLSLCLISHVPCVGLAQWSLSQVSRETRMRSYLPSVPWAHRTSFFSLTISLILSPFLFPQVFYAKLPIYWMALFYRCPSFHPISGVKFYLKTKQ